MCWLQPAHWGISAGMDERESGLSAGGTARRFALPDGEPGIGEVGGERGTGRGRRVVEGEEVGKKEKGRKKGEKKVYLGIPASSR